MQQRAIWFVVLHDLTLKNPSCVTPRRNRENGMKQTSPTLSANSRITNNIVSLLLLFL